MSVYTAVFPLYDRQVTKRTKREAQIQLAGMLPPEVRVLSPWRYREETGVDGRRWLVVTADATGITDDRAREQLEALTARSLPGLVAA